MEEPEWLGRFRRIADEVAAPDAERVDREAAWPESTLRAIQQEGLAGLVVPVEHGGLGEGLYGLARACEVLAYPCASAGLCFGMHCVGSAVIASKATPDQARRFLEPIARGEHITTLALSEPGTGIHFYLPDACMTRDGDAYVLKGTKSFVTNGGHADSYVASAQAAGEDVTLGNFSCVVVPGDADGMTWEAPWDGLGMRGNSSRTFHMRKVRVKRKDRLGEEGDQMWFIFQVVTPYFLVSMAGTYLGVAQRALDEALRHLQERTYSDGTTPAHADVIQHRVGQLWARVARSRHFLRYAARAGDAGAPDALISALAAKAEVAACAVDTVNDCMTLMGGIAYQQGSVLERLLRDARAAHVMTPTTDLLYTWTGRATLGQPLLEE